jgi:hypothetical protein
MIEKFEDLGLETLDVVEDIEGPTQPITLEEWNKQRMDKAEALIKEKLGVTFGELKQLLSNYTVEHAEELTHEFVNIAPFCDYSKLLEDNDSMAEFLKTEAHKVEHWILQGIRESDVKKGLISFEFQNDSVDDGDVFQGFVYVSFQGKIKHAFTQGNDN